MGATILIVDDEESIRRSVADILADEGYEPSAAGDGSEALRQIEGLPPDLVLLDIAMPGLDGIEVLERLRQGWPELPVIMMSGHGTIETAVRATKLGAYDFLEKPLSYDKLLLCVSHGLESARLSRENRALRRTLAHPNELVGESSLMQELKKQIAIAAPTEGRVLITGENGTGKELVARQIHKLVAIDPQYYRPAEVETLLGDASKAKDKLGWTPKCGFKELVNEMVDSDMEHARRDSLVKERGFKLYASAEEGQ